MNWTRVITSLRETGHDSSQKAIAFQQRYGISRVYDENAKQIERHRINGNFCFALADALEVGLEE